MKSIYLLLFLILQSFCGYGQIIHVDTGPGPEDMVVDPSMELDRLLISCSGRRAEYGSYGEIEAYDFKGTQSYVLPRWGEPKGLIFKPHGIYACQEDGLPYLYVLSHHDSVQEHPIIKYRIEEKGLIFERLFQSELLVSPNALVVMDDGTILVCNDARKRGSKWEQMLGLRTGNIIAINNDGMARELASRLAMPAGLNRIGNQVIVGEATGNKLRSYWYQNKELSKSKSVIRIKGPDNIRIKGDQVLTTAHERTFAFVQHINNKSFPSPTAVYQIDLHRGKKNLVFQDEGKLISAGSVALYCAGYYWVGQIFDRGIIGIKKTPSKY